MFASALACVAPTGLRYRLRALRAGLGRMWRDDRAAGAVEYAAVAGLGALGAVSASRAAGHDLAHTFDAIAAVLRSVSP